MGIPPSDVVESSELEIIPRSFDEFFLFLFYVRTGKY